MQKYGFQNKQDELKTKKMANLQSHIKQKYK